ncbi:MAG: tetratricopeptide repeat protein [Gemmatimonadaceae bacterium]
MADSTTGIERIPELSGYSPVVSDGRSYVDYASRTGSSSPEAGGAEGKLAALIKLGTQKQEAADYAGADEIFRQALALGDRTFTTEHPNMVILLNDLTRLYLKQSAHASAEPLLLRLLELKRSKGDDHPEVATVLASLATVRQALGSHESAEQLWRRVLDIRERTLAPNHFATATALEHLGDACAARGKFRDALSAFERALRIRERTLGGEHPSLRVARERIADLELQSAEEVFTAPDIQPSRPERFRLTTGDRPTISEAVSVKATAPIAVEEAPPPPRMTTLIVPRPMAPSPEVSERIDDDDSSMSSPLQTATVDYRNALESIRDELEQPEGTQTFAERRAALVASATAILGKRQVMAGIGATVIALLLIGAIADSSLGGGTDQATDVAAATLPATPTPVPAISVTSALTASDLAAASAGARSVPKIEPTRVRAGEDRSATKKPAEKKSDSGAQTKGIAIPSVSSAVMSRLDSVASRTSSAVSRATDVLAAQPESNGLGSHRSSLDVSGQSNQPQRARLIGDLPSPRIPYQLTDIEGDVRVTFSVDTEGRPVMSTFAVVTSPSPLLTAAVRQVIPEMRFEPARSGGSDPKAIVDVVQVGYRFAKRAR